MTQRPKHPDKDIENAIQFAESKRWRYRKTGKSSHAWGKLMCAEQSRSGCTLSVYSTPKNGVDHANQIRRAVTRCSH